VAPRLLAEPTGEENPDQHLSEEKKTTKNRIRQNQKRDSSSGFTGGYRRTELKPGAHNQGETVVSRSVEKTKNVIRKINSRRRVPGATSRLKRGTSRETTRTHGRSDPQTAHHIQKSENDSSIYIKQVYIELTGHDPLFLI
jgi:hypothetical protein